MPSDPKTFTQDDVNAIVAKDRKKHEDRIRELEAEIGNHQTIKAEAARRVTELEQQVTTLTTERDTARNELSTAKTTHAAELGAVQRKLDDSTAKHQAESTSAQLSRALGATGQLHAPATVIASRTFEGMCVPEINEDGALVAVTYNSVRFEDASKAGEAFLNDHPYFAQGARGGGGTRRQDTGGSPNKTPITDPRELANRGWATEPK